MSTLFAKILLWFLATILITATGFMVIDTYSEYAVPRDRRVARTGVGFLLSEARHVLETEGAPALASHLDRMEAEYGATMVVIDAGGRDIVSGEDRSALMPAADRWFPLIRDGRGFYVYEPDGKGHWFFLEVSPIARLLAPQRLWVIGAVVALCYVLARHLTAPLRGMEHAVERFGQGDFTARLHAERRDELGRLARTLNHMGERIQSLLEGQRTLLHDVSHELRSPLTRLGLAVELAHSGSDRDRALDRIQTEADRLNALVGELLTLSRIDSQMSVPERSAVRLDEILEELQDICSLEASRRRCRLVLDCQKPITFEANKELLRRAVENVIRNALRHAPHDSDVTVTAVQNEHETRIAVRDRGPGVPAESLNRIFEPFYRVDQDRNRETGGSGLGLAIARRAVDSHRGGILARNASPGLEIEIRLPRIL